MRRDRGAALILALGILALLTFLVVAFARVTGVEMTAAGNYRDSERARTVAWSGVERGSLELRRAVTTPGYPVPWLCYDYWDYSQNQPVTPTGTIGMNAPTLLDIGSGQPANRQAVGAATSSPSFGLYLGGSTGGDPLPAALTDSPGTVGGFKYATRLPWPSGIVGQTYFKDPKNPNFLGDYYSLRVTDASAQINLNDGNPHLAKMIDNLVWAARGQNPDDGLGAKIVNARPSTGYRRVEQLSSVPGLSATDQLAVSLILPYVTCVGVADQKVVECGEQAGRPNAYLNVQPRCPINANLAPLPVLVAAFADVGYSGGSVSRSQAYNLASQVIIPYRANPSLQDEKQSSLAPVTGTPQSRRWGIQHWAEFRNLIFSQGKPFLGNDDNLCAAVVANANPNTDLNKFVPDLCIDTRIDKNDVTRGTTELCFGTSGIFTIESLGVILGASGEPVATSLVRSVQRVFDRHTDTTQGDFESGRVDPPGFAIPGLRDICSLPESRNAENAVITGDLPNDQKAPSPGSGSPAGLFAAEYDGQLTFNVITMTSVAAPTQSTTPPVTTPGGVYVGFIDRTIRGTRNDASQNAFPPQNSVTNAPNKARTLENAGQNDCGDPNALLGHVVPPTAGAPDFVNGTDLHPLAVFLGRGAGTGGQPRELSFLQQDTANPYPGQGVVPGDQFLTSGSEVVIPVDQQIFPVGGSTQIGEVVFAVKEEILSWDFRPVDAMGFEFWFKPARRNAPIPSKIVLLDWQSGGPQFPDAKTEDSLVQDEPPFPNYSATAVNGGTSGGITFNPATFNSVVPGSVHATTHDKNINWGAGARLTIWLEPEGDTSMPTGQVDQSYTLHAKFAIQKNPINQAPSFFKYGSSGSYEKEWAYPSPSDPNAPLPIRAGTWHHCLFSWQTPPDMASVGKRASHLYVDGNEQNAFTGEPEWPSEISAQGQYIVAAVLNLEDFIGQIVGDEIAASAGAATLGTFNASAVGADTNPETYRLPCELSSGNTVVWVGQSGQTSAGEQAPNFGMDNAAPFVGLVDNIVFQDGYAKTIQAADFRGEKTFIPRYDTYQPTDPGAAKSNSNILKDLQDQPLFFQKHAHALDWSRPVRIVAADLTAWKQSASGQESTGAAVDLSADQGSVYLRLGWSDWRLEPTGVKANPFANDPDHATSGPDSQWISKFPLYTGPGAPLGFDSSKNAGWTMELSTGAPWNGIASGYLVPTREMGTPTPPVNFAAGGFLTRPGDHTLYALELRPFGDDLSGPRMAPVVDDVSIIYMRWDVNTVIEEEEVVDQN